MATFSTFDDNTDFVDSLEVGFTDTEAFCPYTVGYHYTDTENLSVED